MPTASSTLRCCSDFSVVAITEDLPIPEGPNRHQFRRTALADPLKRGDDVAGLRMRREKRIGKMDRRRAILLAGNKVDDPPSAVSVARQRLEVGNQPVDGLIAILRILLQQLKDNGRQHAGYVGRTRPGASGSEAMW